MAAGVYNFTIEQGATFTLRAVWKDGKGDPRDLAGYKPRMQFRVSVASPEVLLDASVDNGMLSIDPNAGAVYVTLDAATTAAFGWRRAVYDIELESPDGVVTRLLMGAVAVSREVTRDE